MCNFTNDKAWSSANPPPQNDKSKNNWLYKTKTKYFILKIDQNHVTHWKSHIQWKKLLNNIYDWVYGILATLPTPLLSFARRKVLGSREGNENQQLPCQRGLLWLRVLCRKKSYLGTAENIHFNIKKSRKSTSLHTWGWSTNLIKHQIRRWARNVTPH